MRARPKATAEAKEEISAAMPNSVTVEQHSVVNYAISPQIMGVIKQSIDIHLRSNPQLIENAIANMIKTNPKFLREILNQAYLSAEEEITLTRLDREEAKIAINEYIKTHPGCKTSNIIEDLKLDPLETLEILKELKKEGSVQSKAVE